MIADLANNPIDPSAISFYAYRSTEAAVFPHDIYLMLIQSIRDSDQAEGGKLVLRWLATAQSEFEDTYERIQKLRQLYDVERTTLPALKHAKWLVGLTSSLDFLTSNLSEAELRRLVSLAVRTWKTKGTEAGLQAVLEAVAVREVRIANYFLFRTLVDSVELGFEEIPDVDPWLIDAPGMQTSILPDDVSVEGPGKIHFDLSTLLGATEVVPHRIRIHCIQSRTTAEFTSYWGEKWGSWANRASLLSTELGLAPGDEPYGNEDYRVGVDPDEYVSDLRIADNGGDLNRELVENLTRVLRSANERILIRYVTFLDSFRRTLDWTLVSGAVEHDQSAGEVRLFSPSADTVLRVDRTGSASWTNYHALARVRVSRNSAGMWAELRFYHQDASNFYALRLTATGGLGAFLSVDRVLAGVRTVLGSVLLPVLHLDTNYTLRVDVTPRLLGGNLIRAYLDGTRHVECNDASFSAGGLELASGPAEGLTATYVEMFQHPLETVRIGPPMSTGGETGGGGGISED